MYYILVLALFILPTISFAQSTNGSLQNLITGVGGFINTIIIPFILGIAFLIFIINAVRFFVIGGNNTEGQENARNLTLYGIGAFVLILSFWGIVNLLTNGLGFNNDPCMPTSDYVKDRNGNRSGTTCPQPQDLEIDTSGFGQNRPAYPPPGGTVGPANPAGPGANLPGRDKAPSTPSSPPPLTQPLPDSPTSFTPDGQSVNYNTVKMAQVAVKTAADSYFTNNFDNEFGYNVDIVNNLFADINKTTNDPIVEIERLKAAVRLAGMGVIPETKVIDYLNAYNTYSAAMGTNSTEPITLAVIKNTISSPLPAVAVTRRNQTKQELTDILVENNVKNTTALDTDYFIGKIYNKDASPEARYRAIIELYNFKDKDGNTTVLSRETKLFDRLLADINTEKIYAGDFELGF